jgi:aldose 1-epimerase
LFTTKKYTLNGFQYIEIKNQKFGCSVTINLSQGASIESLYLNQHRIIRSLENIPYSKSFASAILFPFSGRIPKGQFNYKQESFQLLSNEFGTENAIHGLVHDKKFDIIKKNQSEKSFEIKLQYSPKEIIEGFPFIYTLEVIYTLTEKKLITTVNVLNKDSKTFPFSLGWHPYFACEDLYNSWLKIDADKKIIFNSQMIPERIESIPNISSEQKIANTILDNCYISNLNCIYFKNSNYHIEINSSAPTNYFQIFTPKDRNSIAIEPLTAPANSFNNKFGLLELKQNQTYTIHWEVKLLS